MNNSIWLIIIVVGIVVLLLFLAWKYLKVQKYDNLVMTTGGVKSGKTTLNVYLAVKQYNRQLKKWKFKTFFQKLFKKPLDEKPLFYSTMNVAIPFVRLDKDYIERKKRFRYGSVILVDEATLLADSFDFKNDDFNEKFTLFNKLIAHETKGGYVFYNTQSIGDNHFAVKRCLTRVIYVVKKIKIPFFMLFKTRDVVYSADNGLSIVNNVNNEMEDDGRYILVPKSVWKKFDTYTYSVLTDDLPTTKDDDVIVTKNLKTNYLLRKELHVTKGVKKNEDK